jgi:hypothetical protein
VLRIFQSEINNQISVIKENNEAAFLTSQQHSSIVARVTKWQNAVNNYQQVVDSKGAKPINPATDPVVQGLTTQLTAERKVAATDYHAWQCQLYGGCSAPKGDGVLAQASENRYNADEQQITSLVNQVNAREQQLQATDASSQASRLTQATSALPGAEAELTAATAEQNSLTSNFQATNSATNGLLIRLKALDQLSAGDATLQLARLLLFLLFLVIELLPVTVKLLQPQGNYERILRQEIANELRRARWDMRGGAVPPGMARTAGATDEAFPIPADGAFAGGQRRRSRDPLDVELENVWNTRVEPVADWASRADTVYEPGEDDATGPHRLDDLLRGLSDTRSFANTDEPQGGIERRYDDDDL